MQLKIRKNSLFFTYLCLLLVIISACGTGQASVTPTPSTGRERVINVTPPVPPCTKPGCLNPPLIPNIRPFIDTWNNIHIFQVFDYNFKLNDISQYGKSYDLVWGAGQQGDVGVGDVPYYRNSSPNTFLTYYLPLGRDGGTFANTDIGRDPNRLYYWKAQHPDWLMYRCDKTTPAKQFRDPNMVLDISNPAVTNWQIQNFIIPASQAGFDAIALDNVTLEVPGMENPDSTADQLACGHYSAGQWVQQYNGQHDQKWLDDVLGQLTRLQTAMHQLPHPMALIINFDSDPKVMANPIVQKILAHVDGIVDERGMTAYGSLGASGTPQYLTDSDWTNMVQFVQNVEAQNKAYFIVNEFTCPPAQGVNNDQVQWALSNYLLTKSHIAGVMAACKQDYGQVRLRDEYNAKIGYPLDNLYQNQNVYWRDYSNGLAIVNPSSSSPYTVNLGSAHYVDLYGKSISGNLTLQPQSGIVLLNQK